jgi:hypothetical protein
VRHALAPGGNLLPEPALPRQWGQPFHCSARSVSRSRSSSGGRVPSMT